MDVNKTRFRGLLTKILSAIAESHFVALDLELSGIPSRHANTSQRQTLQDRYDQLKDAANEYTVLQVGLTCVQEDYKNKKYILKPYNFNINPCVDEKSLGVDRKITYSTDAVEFLMDHGFQMELPFSEGVPYLNRNEEVWAMKRGFDRLEKSNIVDMHVDEDDPSTAKLLQNLRARVQKWMKTAKNDSHLSIYAVSATPEEIENRDFPDMTRYEKRFIHQIVRKEYPFLTTKGGYCCVEVLFPDTQREEKIKKERLEELQYRCRYQRGFRWVVDGLSGSSEITEIPVHYLAHDPDTGHAKAYNAATLRRNLELIEWKFKKKRPVLVGHNLFMDLIYLYRTFVGELPQTVGGFQNAIHDLFPTVIDTKFLATWDATDSNQFSSLDELYDAVEEQKTPAIEVSPEHSKYEDSEAYHEAGYDSYTTAFVMIRWSARMESQGCYVHANEVHGADPGTVAGDPTMPHSELAFTPSSADISGQSLDSSGSSPLPGTPVRSKSQAVLMPRKPPSETPEWRKKGSHIEKDAKKKPKDHSVLAASCKFSSQNPFQQLLDEGLDDTDYSADSSSVDESLSFADLSLGTNNIGLAGASNGMNGFKSRTAASGGTYAGPSDPFTHSATKNKYDSAGRSNGTKPLPPVQWARSIPRRGNNTNGPNFTNSTNGTNGKAVKPLNPNAATFSSGNDGSSYGFMGTTRANGYQTGSEGFRYSSTYNHGDSGETEPMSGQSAVYENFSNDQYSIANGYQAATSPDIYTSQYEPGHFYSGHSTSSPGTSPGAYNPVARPSSSSPGMYAHVHTHTPAPQTPLQLPTRVQDTPASHRTEAPALPLKASSTRKVGELMPTWDSAFWQHFANKLRVFGTQEMVLDLDPRRDERFAA